MKKAIAGCSVLLLVIVLVILGSKGSTFLKENDIEVTYRVMRTVFIVPGVASQEVVYSTRTGIKRKIMVDSLYQPMHNACDPDEPHVQDDNILRDILHDNASNSIVKELIESYYVELSNIHGVIQKSRMELIGFTCHLERGVTALCYFIRNNRYDTNRLTGESDDVLNFLCLYDTSSDSLIFIDSLELLNSEDVEALSQSIFDSDGTKLYYNKRDIVIRYSLETGELDTIVHGDIPLIPHNSDDILIYDSRSGRIKLLSKDGAIRVSVKGPELSPTTIFKITDQVFLIGQIIPKPRGIFPRMLVFLVDFRNNSVIELFEDVQGQIFDVKVFPKGN